MATARLRLGQLLVDAKLITEKDLEEVLAHQQADGRRLGALLVERGLLDETQLTQILSHQLSVPWVSLLHIEFSRQLLNLVPRAVAEKYCLVPIYVRHVRKQGETLYVAMDDPTNEEALAACSEHAGLPVRAMIASPKDIRSAIRVYYGVPEAKISTGAVSQPPSTLDATELKSVVEPAPEPEPSKTEEAAEVAAAPAASEDDVPQIEAVEIPIERVRPRSPADKLRSILFPDQEPPPSERPVESIPKPRGRAPRMVALTLLDGTTITLPAKKKRRDAAPSSEPAAEEAAAPSEESAPSSVDAIGPETPMPATLESKSPDKLAEAPAEPTPEPPAEPTPEPPAEPMPEPPAEPMSEPPMSEPPMSEPGLTARDFVAALRAVSQGADASEVLGADVRWEEMFAALLSLMLKKHHIADWEFVDELRIIRGKKKHR